MYDRWPAIPLFGERSIGPCTQCAACEATGGIAWTYRGAAQIEIPVTLNGGTWVRYGNVPLCLEHAVDVAASVRVAA